VWESAPAPATRIFGNAIFSNAGLGIDLGFNGVTPNDVGDGDTGPNNLQNSPVLTSVTASSVEGTLNSTPNTSFGVQFFASTACDPSGSGEGRTLIQSAVVGTDPSGNASFGVSLTVPPGRVVTATATDPDGNTSEFSACLALPAQYHTITPCRSADTRSTAQPALAAGASRSFQIGGECGIPEDASAVAFNFTITQPTAAGDLRIFPVIPRFHSSRPSTIGKIRRGPTTPSSRSGPAGTSRCASIRPAAPFSSSSTSSGISSRDGAVFRPAAATIES
jgi:hypothetical protein